MPSGPTPVVYRSRFASRGSVLETRALPVSELRNPPHRRRHYRVPLSRRCAGSAAFRLPAGSIFSINRGASRTTSLDELQRPAGTSAFTKFASSSVSDTFMFNPPPTRRRRQPWNLQQPADGRRFRIYRETRNVLASRRPQLQREARRPIVKSHMRTALDRKSVV
jgi:hypothetical protein